MSGCSSLDTSTAEQAGLIAVGADVAEAEAESRVLIYPDYTYCRLPYNIAPCNFRILSPGVRYKVEVRQGGGREGIVGGKVLYKQSGRRVVQWPIKQWQQWLSQAKGDTLWVMLSLKQNGGWREYTPFPLYIDTVAISPYLTYRLIEPSYQLCNRLTIEERCLENFKKRALFDNDMNDKSCVNCHTSAWGNPDYSVYHVRFDHKGTYIAVDGKLHRLNSISNRFPQGGTYPAWHPSQRFIAFSTAQAIPFVHSKDISRRTEVIDSLGDIMVYDILRNRILSDVRICTPEKEETFPCFSPDGRTLYFCQSLTPQKDSATEDLVDYSKRIKYSLVSVEFDAETGTFGRIDTLVDAGESGRTVSFPRVSLDGRFLVFCLSDHGTFPIRHPESDLYVIDLQAEGFGPYHRTADDMAGLEAVAAMRAAAASKASAASGVGATGAAGRVSTAADATSGASRVAADAAGRVPTAVRPKTAIRAADATSGASRPGGAKVWGPKKAGASVAAGSSGVDATSGATKPAGAKAGSGSARAGASAAAAKPEGIFYPDRVYRPLSAANSKHTESYHEFSPMGNGRWLMFSSKRDDGMYARPYFCRLDDNGVASKPFMLPQKDPDFYLTFLKSYNVPVFSNGPAPYNVFTTAKATQNEMLYPEAMEIAGEE